MTWETEFEEFLTDTVTREPYDGKNDYNEPTFSGAISLKARVVFKPEVIKASGGETSGTVKELVSRARVYCSAVPGWNARDRITLPDGSQPKILQIVTLPDETGEHHQVVYV